MIRLLSPRSRSSRAFAQVLGLLLLGGPLTARAGDLSGKVEPGVAFPLTKQQSQRFDLGGGGAAKLLYGLGPYLDVSAGVLAFALPVATNSLASGTGVLHAPPGSAALDLPPWKRVCEGENGSPAGEASAARLLRHGQRGGRGKFLGDHIDRPNLRHCCT